MLHLYIAKTSSSLNFVNVKRMSQIIILTGTCPKCQNESMYLDKNPLFNINTLKMKNAVIGINFIK
jgi:hypothetical protein